MYIYEIFLIVPDISICTKIYTSIYLSKVYIFNCQLRIYKAMLPLIENK